MKPGETPLDREHVHPDEPDNVRYWAGQLKCGEEQLLEAVDRVGDAIDDIRRFLVWGSTRDGDSPSPPRHP